MKELNTSYYLDSPTMKYWKQKKRCLLVLKDNVSMSTSTVPERWATDAGLRVANEQLSPRNYGQLNKREMLANSIWTCCWLFCSTNPYVRECACFRSSGRRQNAVLVVISLQQLSGKKPTSLCEKRENARVGHCLHAQFLRSWRWRWGCLFCMHSGRRTEATHPARVCAAVATPARIFACEILRLQ